MDNKVKTLKNIRALNAINAITNTDFHHSIMNRPINDSNNFDNLEFIEQKIIFTSNNITNIPLKYDHQLFDVQPLHIQSFNSEPIDIHPFDDQSFINIQPIDIQSFNQKSFYYPQNNTKPIDTKPIDTKPIDTKPIDTKPIDTKPKKLIFKSAFENYINISLPSDKILYNPKEQKSDQNPEPIRILHNVNEPNTYQSQKKDKNPIDKLINVYMNEIPNNIKNKHKIPDDFNPIIYKRLNSDLINMNIKELLNHYLEYGINENREYKIDLPDNFNANTYKELNNDLIDLSEEELKLHYIKHGFIECRQYIKSKTYELFQLVNSDFEQNYEKYYTEANMVYIIGSINHGGGMAKYYYDLITHYESKKFRFINNKNLLNKINFKSTDIVLIKNLLDCDILLDDLVKKTFNDALLVLTIHDFIWLSGNYNMFTNLIHSSYLNQNTNVTKLLVEFFNKINMIIHSTNFTYNAYSKVIENKNFILINHPDIVNSTIIKTIPKIENNTINLLVPSKYYILKGAEYINKLIRKYSTHKDHIIKFYLIGDTFFNSVECSNCINLPEYDENEFFNIIKKESIHGLIYLNKFGESWSYCLTKGLISGLPIYYSQNGSYSERMANIDHYFGTIESNYENDFAFYLDYIIKYQSETPNTNSYDNLIMVYPKIYDMIFKKN
jgi:hypothetical protein